jgi:hypothetical protein
VSGFRRDVDGICDLLGCYAASSGNPLPTFRYNVSVPPSRVKTSGAWKVGPIRCSETLVKDYHLTLRNIPEDRRSSNEISSHFAHLNSYRTNEFDVREYGNDGKFSSTVFPPHFRSFTITLRHTTLGRSPLDE